MKIASFSSAFAFLLLAGLAFTGASVVAPPAAAQGCCADYARDTTVKRESKEVVTQLTERINAMQLALIESMRLSTGQLSSNAKEQIASTSNIASVQDDRETVGRAEMARFNALLQSGTPASLCSFTTINRATSTLADAAASSSAYLTAQFVDRNLGEGSSGIEEERNSRIAFHCDRFASAQDVDSGLCQRHGEMPNADVNIASSVYHRDVNSSRRGLANERLEAGALFITNTIDPIPQGPMLPGEAATPEGRIKAAARMASAGRTSVALEAATSILASRQLTTDNLNVVQAKAGTIDGYNGDLSKGYSDIDYLEIMARSWQFNSEWSKNLAGQGIAETIKEVALMQAFQNYQDFRTYEQVEKQTMILAQILGILTEQARPDRVASR